MRISVKRYFGIPREWGVGRGYKQVWVSLGGTDIYISWAR